MSRQNKLLSVIALLLPVAMQCRSFQQFSFVCHLLIALFVLWIVGGIISAIFIGDDDGVKRLNKMPCLRILLGQFGLLFTLQVLSPLLFAVSKQSYFSINISFSIVLSIGILYAIAKLKKKPLSSIIDPIQESVPVLLTTLLFLACVGKVAALYSIKVGAIGLDTHQHIYWSQHIADFGYFPLAARHTDILEQYTKGLHAITSIWIGAGLNNWAESFLKIQPFLQLTLVLFSMMEILIQQASETSKSAKSTLIFTILLCVIFFYFSFQVFNTAYPTFDLSGTGRISAAAVVSFPIIVILFGRLFESEKVIRIGWALTPLFWILSTKYNPSFFISFPLLVGPLMFFLSMKYMRTNAKRFFGVKTIAITALLAAFSIFSDPMLTEKMSVFAPKVSDVFLSVAENKTVAKSTTDGDIRSKDFWNTKITQEQICTDIRCRLEFTLERLPSIVTSQSVRLLHPLGDYAFASEKNGRFSLFGQQILLGLSVIYYFFRKKRLSKQGRDSFSILLTFTLGILVFANLNNIFVSIINAANTDAAPILGLLAVYVARNSDYSSFYLMPTLGFLSIFFLFHLFENKTVSLRSEKNQKFAYKIAIGLVLLTFGSYRLYSHRVPKLNPNNGFWTGIDQSDLGNLQTLESMAGCCSKILVPARHEIIGHENWILPAGSTAAYLPFGRNNYIFNVQLGRGYLYGWRDLANNFCSSIQSARDFIVKEDIKYLFLAGEKIASTEFYASQRICNWSLAELGVKHPPKYVSGESLGYFEF